jgi:hypothetical protein
LNAREKSRFRKKRLFYSRIAATLLHHRYTETRRRQAAVMAARMLGWMRQPHNRAATQASGPKGDKCPDNLSTLAALILPDASDNLFAVVIRR